MTKQILLATHNLRRDNELEREGNGEGFEKNENAMERKVRRKKDGKWDEILEKEKEKETKWGHTVGREEKGREGKTKVEWREVLSYFYKFKWKITSKYPPGVELNFGTHIFPHTSEVVGEEKLDYGNRFM